MRQSAYSKAAFYTCQSDRYTAQPFCIRLQNRFLNREKPRFVERGSFLFSRNYNYITNTSGHVGHSGQLLSFFDIFLKKITPLCCPRSPQHLPNRVSYAAERASHTFSLSIRNLTNRQE